MKKTVSKPGNSSVIMFGTTQTDMAIHKTGDEMDVELHACGAITLGSIRPGPSREQVTTTIKSTLKSYHRTMKRLA